MDTSCRQVWPGQPYPLGATWDGEGVNFAIWSQAAEQVELCLFDAGGRHEVQRIAMRERTEFVWHAYLPEARPGLLYGWRMHGPYRPEEGLRFNPHKLLIDPRARDLVGPLRWNDALYGYTVGHRRGDLSFDKRDSAAYLPKCRVVETAFSWGDDRPPRVPWSETVIYELHVRGFSMRHPEVPEPLRGSYAALGSAPVIDYLKRLGITTVELMPVHSFRNDHRLEQHGLQNYWGYNSLGFFAPEARYSASQPLQEFKSMVKALHHAGIEVLLDVVYNHTAEAGETGPTLSLRGIDHAAYYRLDPERPRHCVDVTGCGNSLRVEHPQVLQLVLDSLRYWVEEMHVDGFRFDLAPALARQGGGFDACGSFLAAVGQDPVLSRVKLIAEPWDLGPGGYQLGRFPAGWSEWNDRFRDAVRRFWRGGGGQIGELAHRLAGSSDLFLAGDKRPQASINFVTAHDGFTLHDLVSHAGKHNLANAEGNRDGSDHNLSWNCGVEGPSDDPAIVERRERHKRNLLATLLLSQGVPMLLAGDERGRSQQGNNNPYCHDGPLNWIDWHGSDAERPAQQALTRYTGRLLGLRRAHPGLRRQRFFTGDPPGDGLPKDLLWIGADGRELQPPDWQDPAASVLGMLMPGASIREPGPQGAPVADDDFLLLLNATDRTIDVRLPAQPTGNWRLVVDSATATGEPDDPTIVAAGGSLPLPAQSLRLLQRSMAAPEAAAALRTAAAP